MVLFVLNQVLSPLAVWEETRTGAVHFGGSAPVRLCLAGPADMRTDCPMCFRAGIWVRPATDAVADENVVDTLEVMNVMMAFVRLLKRYKNKT